MHVAAAAAVLQLLALVSGADAAAAA